jgi:uncharacterized membrane protein YedE/YeeE
MDFVLPLVGGAVIGLAASILLIWNGQVAGISGMVAGLLPPERGEWPFRAWFIAGLLLAGTIAAWTKPYLLGSSARSLGWLALAGLLVGIGTRMAGGCTSGHGVCGISRLSPRSIVATLVFMGFGIVTVTLLRVLGVAS